MKPITLTKELLGTMKGFDVIVESSFIPSEWWTNFRGSVDNVIHIRFRTKNEQKEVLWGLVRSHNKMLPMTPELFATLPAKSIHRSKLIPIIGKKKIKDVVAASQRSPYCLF